MGFEPQIFFISKPLLFPLAPQDSLATVHFLLSLSTTFKCRQWIDFT